jgi:hypothetical protein
MRNDFTREKKSKPQAVHARKVARVSGHLVREASAQGKLPRPLKHGGEMSQRKRQTAQPAPDFGRFMRFQRFESPKSHATAAVADKFLMATGNWWPIRAGIEDFVANRKRTALKSAGLVPDESMSAIKVRSTNTGKWPRSSVSITSLSRPERR